MAKSVVFGRNPGETIGRALPSTGSRSENIVSDITAEAVCGERGSGMGMVRSCKTGRPFQAATTPMQNAAEAPLAMQIKQSGTSDNERLQAELRLSQKMEAMGRLAGGIAHDFNNLLTIINGYAGMLLGSLKGSTDAASQAEAILSAAKRAAELVSCLLSFSRRQTIKVRLIAAEQLVNGVEPLLRRLICEHIELRTELDPSAGWIRADLNQMESVLLNLATNAQDAMPQGGLLSITTARVDVTPNLPCAQPGLPVGSYVLLTVSDSGHGMDAETQLHVFEPFFTTKELGKGTGLGLHSVFTSVEQSGGRIFVTSKPGLGTRFSIYLPRIDLVPPNDTLRVEPDVVFSKGTGIILLVEDEGAVRRMMRDVLCKAGYTVWEADNGAKAIELWADRLDDVDLVVTDIIMPVMNGLKLAELLRNRRGDLQVVYISGYPDQVIKGQLGPPCKLDVLQKPFVPDTLVRKVGEVLKANSVKVKHRHS